MSNKTTYEGKDISISLMAISVFTQDNVKGPWINPNNATPEEITAIAHSYPSGAITFERHNAGRKETAPLVNTMFVRENGPLPIHAELTADEKNDGFKATLCRCGASKRKPYCDSSHTEEKFTATEEISIKEFEPLYNRDGEVAVTSLPDGPLQIVGNLEICCGTGHTIEQTKKSFYVVVEHQKTNHIATVVMQKLALKVKN